MTAYIAAGLNHKTHTRFLIETKGEMSDHIIKTVAAVLNVPLANLFQKTRKREIVEARQISMSLIKQRTNLPVTAIGRKFGQDHSTVLYAIDTVSDLCSSDKLFRRKVERIEESL